MKTKNRRPSGARFAMLPVNLVMHVSVTTLDHGSFRVLVLLAMEYRGKNNGAIGLTREQAKAGGIGGKNTLYKALRDLIERGLIEITHYASRVPPRPAMYAINWLPVDDTEYSEKTRLASHEYRNFDPSKINFRYPATGNKGVRKREQGDGSGVHGPHYGEQGPVLAVPQSPLRGPPLESTIGSGGDCG